MPVAGRILILPKGDWNETDVFEMLDLVSHGGYAWLAKKTSQGIEPSAANVEYWHKLLELPTAVETKCEEVFDEKIKGVKPSDIGALSQTYENAHYEGATDGDETNLNAWLDSLLNSMPDNSTLNIRFKCQGVSTMMYYGTLCKQDSSYATIMASACSTDLKGVLHKVKFNGMWEDARFIAYN